MRLNLTLMLLLLISSTTMAQHAIKINYTFSQKLISFSDEDKFLDYGYMLSNLVVITKQEKTISYSTPVKQQTQIKKVIDNAGKDVPYDEYNKDSIQNLYFIDTIKKIAIFRRTIYGATFSEIIGQNDKKKIRTEIRNINIKTKLDKKNYFKFLIFKEQKKINGILCNKGEIRNNKNALQYNIWIAKSIKCNTTFNCITSCPGLIVEAIGVNTGNVLKLVNYELKANINDSEFELNEFKEPMKSEN